MNGLCLAVERFCQNNGCLSTSLGEVNWLTTLGLPLKYHTSAEFLVCFFSLQISYLTWGVMQELIMNTKFQPTPLVPSGLFPSATFCVFSNRFLAILFSCYACLKFHGTVHSSVPLLKFTPCALSNTISSWSQYKALNYVSFNLQTLFKSTKVIPVMLMGTILKGTHYGVPEYIEAIVITLGVVTFSFGAEGHDNGQTNEVDASIEIIGFALLSTYVLADSFTAQYQNKIYSEFGKVDHYHMMFGVNVSSIILTATAMLFSGEIMMTLEFLYINPTSLLYNILTAICSTTGQVAIYYTIKRFGPITFVIIMTTRQMFSMIISTIVFGHNIGIKGAIGSLIVFMAVFHSIYRQQNEKGDQKSDSRKSKNIELSSISLDGTTSSKKIEEGENNDEHAEQMGLLLNPSK